MAKQVVTESHAFDHVSITLSYDFDPALIGKKEREEVIVIQSGNRKTVKYWINVADNVPNAHLIKKLSQHERLAIKRQAKALKKQEIAHKLHCEKRERMERYSRMIELGDEIIPSDSDYESARKLQDISLRAQNKKLCKLV